MIKAIIFDCFGVLTTDSWREFCATLSPGSNVEKARDVNRAYDRGDITYEEFVKSVVEITGQPEPTVRAIYENSDENMMAQKNKQLLRYIKELKTNYKTAILSNVATNWIVDYFLTEEEQKLFDVMVFSFETGFTKPDPRIYQLTAEKLGVQSEECVFIDDIDRYVDAAKNEGMQAFVYENFAEMKIKLEKLLDSNN